MADPLVSVLLLNFNGGPILGVMQESVRSLKAQQNGNLELIFADNASTDGSFEAMSKFIRESGLPRFQLVQAERNLGFSGGNNLAFRHRSIGSKYVLLLNNDAVLAKDSLNTLVKKMEGDVKVGACSGVIARYDGLSIDSAGYFIDEMYSSIGLCEGDALSNAGFGRELQQTYAHGACALLRTDAVSEVNARDAIFDEELFIYFDDSMICLKMWNRGYTTMFYPVVTARHLGGASLNTFFKLYHDLKGRAAMAEALPSRYKTWHELSLLKMFAYATKTFPGKANEFRRSVGEGKAIGRGFRARYNLDLYKAPLIELTRKEALQKVVCGATAMKEREAHLLFGRLRGEGILTLRSRLDGG